MTVAGGRLVGGWHGNTGFEPNVVVMLMSLLSSNLRNTETEDKGFY